MPKRKMKPDVQNIEIIAAYISETHFAPLFRPGYLRGRVSYSWVKDSYNDVNYRMGTFYSYDAHGNVKTLFHDYHEGVMEDAGNAFKRMDYEYDLISGKVREVRYQDGEADAFYHRYRYDGENRLKTVETSRDKILWQRDAKYGYYKHGPVARLELGELQVQGLDYAYTLQGWLKGVNSTGVGDGAFDMGGDGVTGTANALFAKDEFGFSLNYYNKTELGITRVDYSPINASGLGTNTPFLAGGVTELTASSNAVASSLFNGNIASMFVNIRKLTTGTNNDADALLYAYRYDQLNRLKKMQVFEGFDNNANAWSMQTATDDYKEAVDYDANGNITHYKRNGRNSVHGLNMDDLTYHYKTNNNQLRSVSDAAGGSYADDIKDQVSADNYAYDEIGNLTKDESEGITEVKWTVYGKVGSIWKACSGCGSEGYKAVEYTYDGMGNRISKTYKSAPDASPKTTWYVRDASGNVMSVYEKEQGRSGGDLVQSEVDVYGSGRLGIYEPDQVVEGMQLETGHHSFTRRKKLYDLSNYLSNVLVTVSDKKIPVDTDNDGIVDYYAADVISAQDYYPFGMTMPGRSYGTQGRYGFNGQEKSDDVTKGNYTAQFWEYDSRIGRRWNVDPIPKVWESSYATFSNNPIWFSDPNGSDTTNPNKVMIDPGHGDKYQGIKQVDPGAGANGVNEKDITLNIGTAVNKYLTQFGVTNEMTRTDDKTDAGKRITWRIQAANDANAGIFVSIHADAAGPDASGFHVIYQEGNTNSTNSKSLAESIAGTQTTMNLRGTGVDKDVRNLGVLREFNKKASVLIETGYITNEGDRTKLVTNADDIGKQIATGIYKFINNGPPPTPNSQKSNSLQIIAPSIGPVEIKRDGYIQAMHEQLQKKAFSIKLKQ